MSGVFRPESKNQALGKATQSVSKAAVYFNEEFLPPQPMQCSCNRVPAAQLGSGWAGPPEPCLESGLPGGVEAGSDVLLPWGLPWGMEAW